MKHTIYGVIGYKGKLGSLLVQKPNFVPIDCDIANINSVRKSYKDVAVLVNCAAISSVDNCESHPKHAHLMNVLGTNNVLEVYRSRVLQISSDYVFPPWRLIPPKENAKPFPTNVYGLTKMVGEDLAIGTYGAKVIRLSRTIDKSDNDLSQYFHSLSFLEPTPVPSFFYRNYLTRSQAVDGIEYFVRNWGGMPNLVNFGSEKPISFYTLMKSLVKRIGLDHNLVEKRTTYDKDMTPRPTKSGFSTSLAKKLGFPIYTLEQVTEQFWN